MTRPRVTACALALAATLLSACEPPPPPPVFQVTTLLGGDDASPGDGVCETAAGNGVCTTTAAVQEGNALGRAVIDVPEHTDVFLEPPFDVPVITGDITLRSTYTLDNGAVAAWSTGLRVDPEAVLRLEHFTLVVRGGFVVDGTVVMDSSALAATTDVNDGGVLFVVNSMVLETEVVPPGKAMINNDGTLFVRFSDLWATQPLLHSGPTATSIIGASVIHGPEAGACTGSPVISEGYNADYTAEFGGDACVEYVERTDAVPAGSLGCGTAFTVDHRNHLRPADDDGDGVAMCDAGPAEGTG